LIEQDLIRATLIPTLIHTLTRTFTLRLTVDIVIVTWITEAYLDNQDIEEEYRDQRGIHVQ